MDFDTGSSDLFLPGPFCQETCSGHTVYDPSESHSASDTEKSFHLKFGDGSTAIVEGYTDVVSIAGLSVSRLLLTRLRGLFSVHLGPRTSGWRRK